MRCSLVPAVPLAGMLWRWGPAPSVCDSKRFRALCWFWLPAEAPRWWLDKRSSGSVRGTEGKVLGPRRGWECIVSLPRGDFFLFQFLGVLVEPVVISSFHTVVLVGLMKMEMEELQVLRGNRSVGAGVLRCRVCRGCALPLFALLFRFLL